MSNEIARFEDLKLSPEILKAVGKMGFPPLRRCRRRPSR